MNDLNEDNIKQQINDFIDSLNEQEQLYYDLFFQSIIEAPNLSSKINSWLSPIIKILRDTIGTFIGIKISSFTGSKLLIGLTASVGTSIFIKDITDIVLKKRYFSENEEFRKIYHINQRNSYDKRWNVMKRKIINTAKKVFNPIKKKFCSFLDKKFLKLDEEIKVGFDDDFIVENIEENTKTFRKNVIQDYFTEFEEKIAMSCFENYKNLKNILVKKKKGKKYDEIKKYNELKRQNLKYKKKSKMEKLIEEYPQVKKDTMFIEKLKSKFNSMKNFFFRKRKKKEDNEIRLQIIKNIEYQKYYKNCEEIQNKYKEKEMKLLQEEVYDYTLGSKEDFYIVLLIEKYRDNEQQKLENDIHNFKFY